MTDKHWRDGAACLSVGPEFFDLPDNPESASDTTMAPAIAVCAGCPVSQDCLDDALEQWREGVAGGYLLKTAPAARRNIPESWVRNIGCGTEAGWQRHYRRGEHCAICDQWQHLHHRAVHQVRVLL